MDQLQRLACHVKRVLILVLKLPIGQNFTKRMSKENRLSSCLTPKSSLVQCPQCKASNLCFDENEKISCNSCKASYRFIAPNCLDMLTSPNSINNTKHNIQQFWGDLYQQWYSELDSSLDEKTLQNNLVEMEKLFYQRKLLPVTELTPEMFNDKLFLEIGCGGGGHSSYFKKHGANIVAVDITPERAVSTAKKFSLINPPERGFVCLADAENLPFKDNSFDIVYSNGVLHHSENTDKCFNEVHRVLKPNGRAVIMLYSRHSAQYWANLFIKAILTGEIFRFSEKEWLGRLTEGKPKFRDTKNPLTRVYSSKEIKENLNKFNIISLRKNGFLFSQLPLISKLRTFVMNKLLNRPFSQGGTILYGSPFIPESNFETLLAPYIGWSWNIVVEKK